MLQQFTPHQHSWYYYYLDMYTYYIDIYIDYSIIHNSLIVFETLAKSQMQ